MHQAYVALIVLATVFSMACYKIVMQHTLVGKAHVYTKIIHVQVTCGTFYGIPHKSIA